MLGCYGPLLTPYGLTVSQLFVLLTLYETDGVTPNRLLDKLALSASTLTGILGRLEKKGLLTRELNLNDRRSIVVSLTEKAKSLKNELWRLYAKVNDNLQSALSKEELEILENLLERLGAHARKMNSQGL
jgi:DNA-binding MarR family transcriptional regulator